MYIRMAKRLIKETDKRLLTRFLMNFGWRGMKSMLLFKRRLKRGEFFPPFLYISVINSCNLRCQGCWVDVAAKQEKISNERLDRLIGDASKAGNAFFGILGGEPFMHKGLLDVLEKHPRCYFQIFTNGQLITRQIAARMRRMGNITPLVSVEGNEIISDQRRGRKDVYQRTMEGLQHCLDEKLITGVCTSLCQTNIDDLLREEWVDRLIEMGVLYTWFHTYRPVGPEPNEQLSLTPEQQVRIRKFVVEMRAAKPIAIIDAYYDGEGQALCPAATGISHHISPWGSIEPCPIIQFGCETIDDSRGIHETMTQSAFLQDFRKTAAGATRGCIVLERPDLLEQLISRHGAQDGTARKTALKELQAMQSRPSQFNPATQIPEKNLVYRMAKRFFYNDFGAYNGTRHTGPPAMPMQKTGHGVEAEGTVQ